MPSIIEDFVGKEVIFSSSFGEVIGVVNAPNYDLNYVDILPHLVIEADRKHVYLERNTPVRLGLGVLADSRFLIRPLKEGYIERNITETNSAVDRTSKKMGF